MKLGSKKGAMVAASVLVAASAFAAAPRFGIVVAADYASNPQEKAAAEFIVNDLGGTIITPSDLSTLTRDNYEAVMVHIDRLFIGQGVSNLPTDYQNAVNAVANFAKAGGGVYLSKMATQLAVPMGRLAADLQVNIFGDGDGGAGTDDWAINAQLGSWQLNSANADPDMSQYYDRSNHPIYAGLEKIKLFPDAEQCGVRMEGTGNGSSMHREDHNCMWDLNALPLSGSGKNTLEQWENQTNSVVIGTWGHVQDYCVVGINEFNPNTEFTGKIIANGLAACEWAPRQNNNAFHSNLETLTRNVMNYIAAENEGSSVASFAAIESEAVYYNLSGARVANPAYGLFIKVQNGKATKVIL